MNSIVDIILPFFGLARIAGSRSVTHIFFQWRKTSVYESQGDQEIHK